MEYTAQDFAEVFKRRYGMKEGKTYDPIYCLLPHIMMGVAYEYYEKDIQHLELRQNLKHYRTLWAESYTKFNRFLFDAFDLDMADAFCDKMDKFKRFMYADLVSLQSKLMRCLPADMDADRKRVMAAAMMTNRIAKLAEKLWGVVFYTEIEHDTKVWDEEKQCYKWVTYVEHEPTMNNGISGVLTNSKRFGLEYVKGDKRFKKVVDDEALAADLYASIDAFEMKCLKFKDFDKATA